MKGNQQSHHGFTLVEVMIALTISALLLTAVATVFQASLMSYQENQEIYEAVSRARQAMLRITTQLRTADYVFTTTPQNQCDFMADANSYYLFEYQSANNKLVLNDGTNTYDLCSDVSAMEFQKQADTTDPNSAQSVRITMTVDCGDASQQLASAVVIRKAL